MASTAEVGHASFGMSLEAYAPPMSLQNESTAVDERSQLDISADSQAALAAAAGGVPYFTP